MQKRAVLDDGVTNPTVSNVAGVNGQTFSYELAYTCVVNSGYTCKAVTVTDDVPASLEIVGSYPADWTIAGNHVVIPIGDVGPGAGTRQISVRFRTDPTYATNQQVTAVNQASVSYEIATTAGTSPEAGSDVSNSVSLTGVVAPLGGVTATKTISPGTAQEFAGSTTTVALGAKDTGTDVAELVLTDENADFFSAFDLSSVPVVTAPAGTTSTVEVKVAGVWGPVPATLPADVDGVRVTVEGVPTGQSASVSFGATLRNARADGTDVVAGDSLGIDNTSQVAANYADASIDRTATATAHMTVTGATSGTARLTKSVSPTSVLVGSTEPITYSLTNSWSPSGAVGGVGGLVFSDPVAGGNNPFTSDVDVDAVTITWPTSEAATATLETNCGTTGPVSRTGDDQAVPLPCAGDLITSVKVTITPATPYPAAAAATVKIVTHLESTAANTAHVVKNDARVDTMSAYGNLPSTASAADVSFSVQQPTFQVTTSKRFAKPSSSSATNVVILTSQAVATPSNASVSTLVVQDPPDPTVAANFYNQYDITGIRPLTCPSGYAATVEIWDGSAWVTPSAMTGDACSYTSTVALTPSEEAVATGVRITYTRPTGGVSTVSVQPKIEVSMRATDRGSGAAQTVPAFDPNATVQGQWTSSPNCATSTLLNGTATVASSTTTGAGCPTLTQVPASPSSGGGFGITKTLGKTLGGSEAPLPQELSGQSFYARLSATQTGALSNVASVTVSDPVGVETTSTGTLVAGYSATTASQIFASATNITGIASNAIPAHERATLQMWNVTTQAWETVQVVAGNGSSTISYVAPTSSYAAYGGWRITVDENPADPGDNVGFLESTSYAAGSKLVVDVAYQLRSSFRTSVSVHSAGDIVLNNLCYGVSSTVLAENTNGSVAGACDYTFAPYTDSDPEYANDAGRLINDATVASTGAYGDDPTLVTASVSTGTGSLAIAQRDVAIQSTVFNAEVVKSFLNGGTQVGNGVAVPATVPIPASGQQPGSLQERTLRLQLLNQTAVPMTLTATDTTAAFWSLFELVKVQPASLVPASPGYDPNSHLTYTLTYTDGHTFTGTLPAVNALTDLTSVVGVTAVASDVPSGSLVMPQGVNVDLLVRLRASVTQTDAAVNDVSLTADAYGSPFTPRTDSASIKALPSQHGVQASKALSLAAGQVNAVDLKPVLNVTVGALNSGDLPVKAMAVEDDDDLTTGYTSPSVPATLPANTGSDFWPNVTFQHLTAVTYPAGTTTVAVDVRVNGSWVSVGTFPAGTSASDIDAAIALQASPSAVAGVRAVFSSAAGLPVASSGALTYQVSLHADAPTTVMTNCSEAGMVYVNDQGASVAEFQNPACASFTPSLGSLSVDVDKSTTVSTALSGDVVPFTLTITNTGQQSIGLHAGASPLTVVDTLPSSLVWDASVAAASATFPAPSSTSTFSGTLPAASYNAATNAVSWTFPAGESLGAGGTVTIRFSLRVAAAVAAGQSIVNRAGVVMPNASSCASGDQFVGGACTDTASLSISSGGNVLAVKTIDAGPTATSVSVDPTVTCANGSPQAYPCVALTPAGSSYTWKLSLQNSGNVNLSGAVLLDRLPAVGDTTVQGGYARGTEWTAATRGAVTVSAAGLLAGSATVSYLPATGSQACFTEISSGSPCGDWVTLPSGQALPSTAIGLRVAVPYSSTNGLFAPGATVTASWAETVPASLAGTADVANAAGAATSDGVLQQWNNFSARVDAGTSLQVSSYKAGAQFDSAAFDIRKIVDESTVLSPADYGSFTIGVVCRANGSDVYTGTVTLADSQLARVNGLPTGATCTLTEQNAPSDFTWAGDEDPTTPAGDYTIAYNPATSAPVTAVLTNRYAGQVVAVDAVVRGTTTDTSYAVSAACTYNGTPLTLAAGQASFTISTTAPGALTGLPAGAVCTVTETDNGHADYSDATVSTQPGSAHGTETVATTFTVGDTTPVVTFTNSYVADLTVTKTVTTDAVVPVSTFGPFGFSITCGTAAGSQTVTKTDVRSGDAFTWSSLGGAELLAGASCTVTETATGGAQSVTVGGTGTDSAQAVLAQGPNTVAAVNTFSTASLTVTNVQRGDIGTSVSQGFSVDCTVNGVDITSSLPADQQTFTLGNGAHTTLTGLPLGAQCTVTETDQAGADRTEVELTDANHSGTDPAQQVLTTTATIGSAQAASVRFTNTYLASLVVTTSVVNPTVLTSAELGPFSYSVTCVNPDGVAATATTVGIAPGGTFGWTGTLELLAGATCTVTQTDTGHAQSVSIAGSHAATAAVGPLVQGTTEVPVVDTYTAVVLTVAKQVGGTTAQLDKAAFSMTCTYGDTDLTTRLATSAFRIGAGETQTVGGLPVGAVCLVTETDRVGAVRTSVLADGSTITVEATDSSAPAAQVTMSADQTVVFTNRYEVSGISIVTGDAENSRSPWLVAAGVLLLLAGGVGCVRARASGMFTEKCGGQQGEIMSTGSGR